MSKAGAGCGRASGDRQFLFVNGRPVEMPKVGKLLNETYRAFNSLQYPMAVLNFVLPTVSRGFVFGRSVLRSSVCVLVV